MRKSTLDGLKKLDFDQLKSAFGEFLSDQEIGDIVSRRDGMVKYFENLAGQKGVENVVKND